MANAPIPSFSGGIPNCAKPSTSPVAGFVPHWNCGETVYVDLSHLTSTEQTQFAGIVSDWNSALDRTHSGMFYFTTQYVPGKHRVAVGISSHGTQYNGQVYPMNYNLLPDSINLSSGSSGGLVPVAYVEFSHLVGWNDVQEARGVVMGVTDHCTSIAQSSSPLYVNTAVCQHEVEGAFAAYGVRTAGDPSQYRHIITGTSGLSNHSIQVGDTLLLQASPQFQRANPAFCGGDYICNMPGIASIAWSISNGSIVSIVATTASSLKLVATGAGQTTVTAGLTPDTNEVSALFPARQATSTVTITSPPSTNPSSFTIGGSPRCQQSTKVGVILVRYHLTWQAGAGPWEIRSSNVNNGASAPVMATGSVGTTSIWTPWYTSADGPARYWWIHTTSPNNPTLVPNAGNGQLLADGCTL